ncbi:MAG: hypothetical protein JXA00_00440 [Candidatus Thermoplasmatota archaeon]|nr:hypothetical protein [Candidatus Thermoplasmatota archaeon]
MVEHKNESSEKNPSDASSSYSMNDVFKIVDDLFGLLKEKKYPLGAFVHGLVFSLEFAQQSYRIPQQTMAEIKRDCRRTVQDIITARIQKPAPPSKPPSK